MKLREALNETTSHVRNTFTGKIYPMYEVVKVPFTEAEQDVWEPVVKRTKVKKVISGFVNVYKYNTSYFHSSKEVADACSNHDRLACVEVIGTYEVEE